MWQGKIVIARLSFALSNILMLEYTFVNGPDKLYGKCPKNGLASGSLYKKDGKSKVLFPSFFHKIETNQFPNI